MKFTAHSLIDIDSGVQKLDSTPNSSNKSLKPYMCGECGTSYKNKCNLVDHVRNNCNRDKNYKCPICPYRSYRNGNLKSHITRVHKCK